MAKNKPVPTTYYETEIGRMALGDCAEVLGWQIEPESVDLIVTSPPFGLVRKKDYGNVDAPDYVEWFRQFGDAFMRVLKDSGSLVIDIGGAWIPGQPTRSLYHFKLLIMLVEEVGFHLAQEFFWWNPSKLPAPAEWVNIRRIRVKDAVNCVWWLSKTPWPKASNRRVLQPYSDSMKDLLRNGYRAKLRPSGHDISEKFGTDNKAAIPPNLIAVANTDSNSQYLRSCREQGITTHPARFPAEIPEYFIRMLTDPDDLVVDPFAGSCVTGEVCERLGRRWLCVDTVEEYLRGAVARFQPAPESAPPCDKGENGEEEFYRIAKPGHLWNGNKDPRLATDGGKQRPLTKGRGGN
jgi:site-specific DNA-methyltransferase (cytosine-N4-specific)